MTEVLCYICEKSVDIDRLPGHLKGHGDAETRIAYQKVLTERKNANAKRPVYKRRPYGRVERNRKLDQPVGEGVPEVPSDGEAERGNDPTESVLQPPSP